MTLDRNTMQIKALTPLWTVASSVRILLEIRL
jgi:hypothetical protein